MSSLNNACSQLRDEWRKLLQRWRESSSLWNDSVQQHFEKEVWQDFEQVVPTTTEEMKRLAKTIAQARREVP